MDAHRLLLEQCPELISHHAASGELLYASPAAASLLGLPPGELLGRSLFDLASADDAAALRDTWARALAAGGEPLTASYRIARPGGEAWVDTTLRLVTAGEATGTVVAVTRSADARKRAEAEALALLARAEEAARQRDVLVALIPGVTWHGPVADRGGSYRTTFMSDYLWRVTDYTPAEWLGTPGFWRSIIHPDDLERTLAATAHALAHGGTVPPYRVRTRSGGVVWLQSYMHIERDADGAPLHMHGLTLDVTVFKETERHADELLERTRKDAAEREALLTTLAQQAERILELSAPLLPITDHAVVVPLLGPLDAERGDRLREAVLAGVGRTGAEVVIVDVTGAPSLDLPAARALLDVARGARLLGARAVLTGLRPEVARALVELGADLTGIETRGTLQQAVAELLVGRRRGR